MRILKNSTLRVLCACNLQETELKDLVSHLSRTFPGMTRQLTQIAPDLFTSALDKQRSQYLGDHVIEILEKMLQPEDIAQTLLLVDFDLFARGLNFIFGQARCPGRVSVVSIKRLRPVGQTNLELFRSRLRKEAVHELGHTLGLEHCPTASCVMHFSNSLANTDFKKDIFCVECASRLAVV